MARLPVPGGDVDKWAQLLNEYLLVSHDPDGTQRAATVGLEDLRTTNPASQPLNTLVLSNDGTNLVWKNTIEINVIDYGAKGDGVTDDTDAIQRAINAAKQGGMIVFPRGVFLVRGLRVRNKGTALVGDGRWATRIVRIGGHEPLIDISGSGTMIGHARYMSIANLMISGSNMPGVLVRSYYADTCIYQEVGFVNCKGTALDFVEVWDTRFHECTWEDCGSIDEPACLFRNSTLPGTFGYSDDNTNQIFFKGCRWEGWRNGAMRFDGAANGSPRLLNGVFIVSCKMESRYAAGPAFQIYMGTTVVFVNQLYIAIMGIDPGFTTQIDAIEDRGSHTFMTNVYVQWSATLAGIARSSVHIIRSVPHIYSAIGAFYPLDDPSKATIWIEPEAAGVIVSALWANRGLEVMGNYSKTLDSDPDFGLGLPLRHPGSFRITDFTSGKDLFKIDNNPTRPAVHTLGGVDTVGFSDNYVTEKWRVVGASGAAKFAAGKFQVEGTKGYIGVNATPQANIVALFRIAANDRGITVVRQSPTNAARLMEFQDETFNIQGMAIDSNGRPVAVGTPARVTPGTQVSYANPGAQVRDIAGNISAAVRPSPTAPGTIATVTFSRPYAATPLNITITDHSAVWANLYVSTRSTTSFTVSTRNALQGGALLNFDYLVMA